MSKNAQIVLAVIDQKLPVAHVARHFGISRAWVYKLLASYRSLGFAGLTPGSKRPIGNSNAISYQLHDEIAAIRQELLTQGLDAGAGTIRFHLLERHGSAPAISTIWRSLRSQGLVEYSPQKKPKSYLIRFEADQPNQTWQADFTYVTIRKSTKIEVLNFLDDHSRFLISCRAYHRVNGRVVVDDFTDAVSEYGPPQSSLTDNGLVFTSRHRGGRNAYEYLLDHLGIEQKNSRPNHPQTQGKVERFHQTLKRWLAAQPRAQSIKELQRQLDQFRDVYNNKRPHRALAGRTPKTAYLATAKAKPNKDSIFGPSRTRRDRVDSNGKVSLRRAGKMHHVGVGRIHKSKEVFLIIDSRMVIVTDLKTGEVLSENKIEPTRSYWPKIKNSDRNPSS